MPGGVFICAAVDTNMSELKTETLQLTADAFLKRMNPNGDAEGFMYGEDESYNEADVIDVLQEKEDTVLSMSPEGYRRMSRSTEYHGEILTRRAKSGQTTFTPKLLPLVSGTVKVYVGYPKETPWINDDRDSHALEDSKFSVDYETGLITIPGLAKDEWVYATYDHTAGAKLRMFKRLALDLAIVQVVRDTHMDMENYQVYQDLEANVYSTFKKMREKGDARIGIDLFDKIPTVVPLRAAGTLVTW